MQLSPEQTFYQRLIDPSQEIGLRYQAVFQLKNINTQQAITKLVQAYPHLAKSVLLSHQVLYTLGQLQENKLPIFKDFLIAIVNNQEENSLSRHEAAEALANYFLPELNALYSNHLWTCQIAIEKVKRKQLREEYGKLYSGTKQPAAPFSEFQFNSFLKENQLEDLYLQKGFLQLLLQNLPLFIKYRIMYYMRNLANQNVKKTLCLLLSKKYYKTQISLLKHEICFILGQIGCENYQDLVRQCIQNDLQQPIVRHQALAAVASQSKDYNYLNRFLGCSETLIKESAEVAQFQIHYWHD